MTRSQNVEELRIYRNSRLYRSLTRTLRVYNRMLLEGLRERGFADFLPAFPSLLSNLDMAGTRIGVLAMRAGVTRQAASQLARDVERCGYVRLESDPDDARATIVRFTPRGRRLHASVLEPVQQIERDFAENLPTGAFEHVREGLFAIAQRIDPGGALGVGDER
jgi:DNA-binding MarR family transcriptional regulator